MSVRKYDKYQYRFAKHQPSPYFEKDYMKEFAREMIRCVECRLIISKKDSFQCDRCVSKNKQDSKRLCQNCLTKCHSHPEKLRRDSESTKESYKSAEEFDGAATTKKDVEEILQEIEEKNSKNQEIAVAALKPNPMSSLDMHYLVSDTFKFILDNFLIDAPEQTELQKRQFDLENKKNQFWSLLRQFDNDLRALFDSGNTNADEDRQRTKIEADTENANVPTDRSVLPVKDAEKPLIDFESYIIPNERQIFIGALPSDVQEKELIKAFGTYGRVVGIKLLAEIPGQRPCAFLAFETADTVQRILRSPPLQIRPRGYGSDQLYVEQKCSTAMVNIPDNHKIRVLNLPWNARLTEITQFFEQYGKVLGAKLRFNHCDTRRVACAYVAFDTAETARRVLDMGILRYGPDGRRIVTMPTLGAAGVFNHH